MPRMVFACDYCSKAFSTHDEAVRHEKKHFHKCENPLCGAVFAVQREGQNYCSSVCNKRAKQQRWRERQKVKENVHI